MNVDFASFFIGFLFCMVADVFFSIANFFLERAFEARARRKATEKEDKECFEHFVKHARECGEAVFMTAEEYAEKSEDQDNVR